MNELVCMKNRFTSNGGGKRLVRPFKRQEFWKCISCVLLAVTYGKKGHNLLSEIPKYFGNNAPNKLQRNFRGNTNFYKVCCDIYRRFYIYACHWIILLYTTLFNPWIFLWVLTYISPFTGLWHILDKVKGVQDILAMLLCWSVGKSYRKFWKIRGLIDRFNESRRQIALGEEKRQMSQWVPYDSVPSLKEIYRTTPIYLESWSHWGHRFIMWRAQGWGWFYN